MDSSGILKYLFLFLMVLICVQLIGAFCTVGPDYFQVEETADDLINPTIELTATIPTTELLCNTQYPFSAYRFSNDDKIVDYDKHVKSIGVTPVKDYESMLSLIRKKKIVPVLTNHYGYGLALKDDNMRYLIPRARKLLYDLAESFKRRISATDLWHVRLKVTSIFRTAGNNPKNSSKNSPHKRGCAFDISYISYLDKDGNELYLSQCQLQFLENELAATVEELKTEGRLFKTREIGSTSKCFHIVVE